MTLKTVRSSRLALMTALNFAMERNARIALDLRAYVTISGQKLDICGCTL